MPQGLVSARSARPEFSQRENSHHVGGNFKMRPFQLLEAAGAEEMGFSGGRSKQ